MSMSLNQEQLVDAVLAQMQRLDELLHAAPGDADQHIAEAVALQLFARWRLRALAENSAADLNALVDKFDKWISAEDE